MAVETLLGLKNSQGSKSGEPLDEASAQAMAAVTAAAVSAAAAAAQEAAAHATAAGADDDSAASAAAAAAATAKAVAQAVAAASTLATERERPPTLGKRLDAPMIGEGKETASAVAATAATTGDSQKPATAAGDGNKLAGADDGKEPAATDDGDKLTAANYGDKPVVAKEDGSGKADGMAPNGEGNAKGEKAPVEAKEVSPSPAGVRAPAHGGPEEAASREAFAWRSEQSTQDATAGSKRRATEPPCSEDDAVAADAISKRRQTLASPV